MVITKNEKIKRQSKPEQIQHARRILYDELIFGTANSLSYSRAQSILRNHGVLLPAGINLEYIMQCVANNSCFTLYNENGIMLKR